MESIKLDRQKRKKGLFITLDGVDGVGKTTTCELLSKSLNAILFKSPSEPFQSTRYIVDTDINPLTRYFFFRAANQSDSKKIEALISAGNTVICDRYVFSTYAYHVAMDKRVNDIFEKTGLMEPDISILLSAPSNIRRERIKSRKLENPSYDRLLENNYKYQNKVQRVFKKLAMFEIDTEQNTPAQVVDIIIERINLFLSDASTD